MAVHTFGIDTPAVGRLWVGCGSAVGREGIVKRSIFGGQKVMAQEIFLGSGKEERRNGGTEERRLAEPLER